MPATFIMKLRGYPSLAGYVGLVFHKLYLYGDPYFCRKF